MTLILALHCLDAIIVASDGQATVETRPAIRAAAQDKVWPVEDWILCGGAGPVGLCQAVRAQLETESFSPQFKKCEPALVRAVSEATKRWLSTYIPVQPANPFEARPFGSFVFACYEGDVPRIVEVSPRLTAEHHENRGYTAVGSADQFAYLALASLAHHTPTERTLAEALAIAYRVLDDAVSASAEGVGYPIHMWVISKPRGEQRPPPTKLAHQRVDYVKGQVNAWREEEANVLRVLLKPQTSADS